MQLIQLSKTDNTKPSLLTGFVHNALNERKILRVLLHGAISCNLQRNAGEGIGRQVAEYMLHVATFLATLQYVEEQSTFPQCNAIFGCETGCGEGCVTRLNFVHRLLTCLVTVLHRKLQKKIASFSRARLHKACGVCLHSMICQSFSMAEYSSHRNFIEKILSHEFPSC